MGKWDPQQFWRIISHHIHSLFMNWKFSTLMPFINYKVPFCYCCLSVFYTEPIWGFILKKKKNLTFYLRLCDTSVPTSLAENPGTYFPILLPGPRGVLTIEFLFFLAVGDFPEPDHLLRTVPHLQVRSQVWPTWHGPESSVAKCLWVYYQPNIDTLWVVFQKRSAYPNNESVS